MVGAIPGTGLRAPGTGDLRRFCYVASLIIEKDFSFTCRRNRRSAAFDGGNEFVGAPRSDRGERRTGLTRAWLAKA
jgi:hypothetical protein